MPMLMPMFMPMLTRPLQPTSPTRRLKDCGEGYVQQSDRGVYSSILRIYDGLEGRHRLNCPAKLL